jgi:ceramide glucosyltransferase
VIGTGLFSASADLIGAGLLLAALFGVVLISAQTLALWTHLRGEVPWPVRRSPISILKPLRGLDDDLAGNLASFAELAYPSYEVLLGVESTEDPAYPVAWAVARRWPKRFRVIVQDGEPGLNPKVNQLITLAQAARHELLLISDSNTRPPPGYLDEIAGWLSDPTVGLVTHPLVGEGEEGRPRHQRRLGSVLDNLHLSGGITPGVVAAKCLCGTDYVVGKSMAMRRSDLEALGGFTAVKDVLAEDFVLGRLIAGRLGKRVALARSPVRCVSARRSMGGFLRRYARWSVMQRQCAGFLPYGGLLLLNPTLLAAAALALHPGKLAAAAVALVAVARAAQCQLAARLLGRRGFAARALVAGPLKDLLVGGAWLYGLMFRTIEWRSHRLLVLRGSVLEPAARAARRRSRRARSDKAPASAAA